MSILSNILTWKIQAFRLLAEGKSKRNSLGANKIEFMNLGSSYWKIQDHPFSYKKLKNTTRPMFLYKLAFSLNSKVRYLYY